MKRLRRWRRRWPMLPWTTLAALVWSVGLAVTHDKLLSITAAVAVATTGAMFQAWWDLRREREDGHCTAYVEGVHCRCWWDDPAATCCGCGYQTPKRHRPTDVEVSA